MTYEEERIKFEKEKVEIKRLQLNAKNQRGVVHKEFTKKHSKLFMIMDILVLTLVLANFGAAIITNILIVQANPEVKIVEANAVQSELNDYEQHPEGNRFMHMLLIQALCWSILLFGYVHTRRTIYTNWELLIAIFILIFYIYLIYYDFFNNLGYLIGKSIF